MSAAMGRALALLLLAGWLAACASPPEQPVEIARYERDLRKGHDEFHAGRLAAAAMAYGTAAANAERHDDAGRLAPALLGMAAVALLREEWVDARQLYHRAGVEARRAGSRPLVDAATLGGAETLRRAGDCAGARTAIEPLLAEEAGSDVAVPARLLLANCLLVDGKVGAALAAFDSLRTPARERPDWWSAWHAGHAAAELAGGSLDAARRSALAALDLDRERRHPPSIAADLRLLSDIAARQGNRAAAIDYGERALRIFRHTGQATPAANLRARLALISK